MASDPNCRNSSFSSQDGVFTLSLLNELLQTNSLSESV
jgi:hypothetical protein